MGTILIFLVLSLLFASVVFGDEVKSVSVTEGHSVTLHTDVIKQKDDLIMWYYGPENTFVARLNGKASSTMYSDDERFRDKLKMNNQTGDLIITHITSQHSGLYTRKIINNNKASVKRYNLIVYGEAKSVSVTEGHSVILYNHVLKDSRDLIEWHYGPENTHVATIDGKANRIMFSDDERFRNRVKMDDRTGALMINDTTTHHSGLYKISTNNKASVKRYNLTVNGEAKSVSVREGHSVILYTHVLKQSHDLIEWHYGPENTLVAIFDGKAGTTRLCDDEKFRDRLKLDDQTGDLVINDFRNHHCGLYKISINKVSNKTFEVSICDVPVLWLCVLPVVVLLLLICVCILIKRKFLTCSDRWQKKHEFRHHA
ncbi:uncharacterized protein LOC130430606 [Triplophysa dalaica]|uniref:uncharacterized protein LOC130430606 n=1 Tax=Triplophysa dalaica TaxID=1582913 RepID=UPI0024DFE79B|nr:uncharacterized protein LOC130430606 [Triplophysa dalaica]